MALRSKRIFLLLFITSITLSLITGCSIENEGVPSSVTAVSAQTDLLQVHFLDVGQADSILIITPEKNSILVDGGNNEDGPGIAEYLKSKGIKKLKAVVATHPHEDHIGGLDTIINEFAPESVYMPNTTSNTKTFEEFIKAVKNSRAVRIQAKAGVEINISNRIHGFFVAPNKNRYDDLNNYSAVLKITYGKISFLLTGDAEGLSETEMLNNKMDLNSTVLKAGHHGSSSSTTSKFLKAVSPQFAIISAGKNNDYGHPSPVVIRRLTSAGVKIYRTDQGGTLIASSDGQTVNLVETHVSIEHNEEKEN